MKVKKIRLLFIKKESQRNFLAHPVLPQFLWVRNLDTAYLDRLPRVSQASIPVSARAVVSSEA